ncbi:hypothetical protein RCL1_004726 [Eukaryota sp. TZLM3-RCL]
MNSSQTTNTFETTSNATTVEFVDTMPLPDRFKNPQCFKYPEPVHQPHPLYRTANSCYGDTTPTVQSMPLMWAGRKGDFTKQFAGGVYRCHGLNTSISRNPVSDRLP